MKITIKCDAKKLNALKAFFNPDTMIERFEFDEAMDGWVLYLKKTRASKTQFVIEYDEAEEDGIENPYIKKNFIKKLEKMI